MKIIVKLKADKGFRFLAKKYLPKAPSYSLNTGEGDGYRRIKRETAGDKIYFSIIDTYLCESARDYKNSITRDEYFSFCRKLCQEYISRLKGLKGVNVYIGITDEYFDGRFCRETNDIVYDEGIDYTEEIF